FLVRLFDIMVTGCINAVVRSSSYSVRSILSLHCGDDRLDPAAAFVPEVRARQPPLHQRHRQISHPKRQPAPPALSNTNHVPAILLPPPSRPNTTLPAHTPTARQSLSTAQ